MPADARERLTSDPFIYRVTKDGRVLISRGGRLVTTIAGEDAAKLAARLDAATGESQVQQLLARATGHYRHGNESR